MPFVGEMEVVRCDNVSLSILTNSDIILHGKYLRSSQAQGQKIQDRWKQVLNAAQYPRSVGRSTSLVDLGDIVKAGILDIHAPWTCDIFSGRTSNMQIKSMIYTLGTHIESKKFNDGILPQTDGIGLPAIDDLA